MIDISSFLVIIIMIIFAFWYSYKIHKKSVSPALSTWIIMLLSTTLSLLTFLIASDWDFKTGTLNLADFMANIIIILSIILRSHIKIVFAPFEKKYLIIALLIAVFWALSKDAFISNMLTQFLIWIGYFPTMQKLLVQKRNTESFSAWFMIFLSGIIAFNVVLHKPNLMSVIYVFRTLLMSSIILSIIFYYDKIKHSQTNNHI